MNAFKTFLRRLWREESAQGATEYILLLVVVVAVVLIFRDKIKEQVQAKLDQLSSGISDVN